MATQTLKLEIITQTFLTIGSEEAYVLQMADIMQLKRTNRMKPRVCIPGTTLKGVLRTSAGQIAHFFADGKDYCNTVDAKEMCRHCFLCELFGASNLPSKVFCEDAYPTKESRIELNNYTQNRINRKTGKTQEGGLFSREQIPPNISFRTSVVGKHLSTGQQEVLLSALKNMNFCSIGRGNGLIEIKIIESQNFDEKSRIINKLSEAMS